MAQQHRLSAATEAWRRRRAVELHQVGWTGQAIAAALGVVPSAVSRGFYGSYINSLAYRGARNIVVVGLVVSLVLVFGGIALATVLMTLGKNAVATVSCGHAGEGGKISLEKATNDTYWASCNAPKSKEPMSNGNAILAHNERANIVTAINIADEYDLTCRKLEPRRARCQTFKQ